MYRNKQRIAFTFVDFSRVDKIVKSYLCERFAVLEEEHYGVVAQERDQRSEETENTDVGRVEGTGAHTEVAQLL